MTCPAAHGCSVYLSAPLGLQSPCSGITMNVLSFEDLVTSVENCHISDGQNAREALRLFVNKLSESHRFVLRFHAFLHYGLHLNEVCMVHEQESCEKKQRTLPGGGLSPAQTNTRGSTSWFRGETTAASGSPASLPTTAGGQHLYSLS